MYDECIAIQNDTIQIRGKHCMYAIEFSLDEKPILPINPTLSICLPVSCTVEDIMNLLNNTINSIPDSFNYTVTIPSVTCSPVDVKIWDTEFIVCFTILVIYIAFLMICTVCEIVSDCCKDFNKNKVVASLNQFSFKKNAAAIFNMEEKQGNISILHGLRAISMAWIVLGQEYNTTQRVPLVNLVDTIDWIKSDDSLYIFVAPFAVDTFFTISGFLMTYLFLKQMSKQKKFNVPMHYLHRFFRLTPAVIALLIFTIAFLPKIGSGPQWQNFIQLQSSNSCRKKWWPTLLYLGNFIDKDILSCLGHLWYLNVDMQLFWISPFILYPLYKKPKIGLTILTSFFLASIVIPAVLININKYRSASYMVDLNKEIVKTQFRDFYQMTYNRAGPWLVGIYFGYEVARNKRQPKKLTIYAGWLLTFGAFSFCVYGTKYFKEPTYEYDAVPESLFTAFSRPLWGFAICWIVYSSIHNCAGPIGSFLSCKIFLPLSRLSFCIYLVHVLVEGTQAAALRTSKYFSDYYTWYYFLSDFAISVVGATFFSLLFESPILVLEKMTFNRNNADKKLPTKSQNDLSKTNTIISNEELPPKKSSKRPASAAQDSEVKPVKRSKSIIKRKSRKLEENEENDDSNRRIILREVTTGGNILTCGQGDVGQLGLGEDILEKTRFTIVPNHSNIVAIAAGGMHNVCLTMDGKVMTFGCNDEGALGRTTSEEGSETVPGFVELPAPAIQVTAGDSHSAALLEDGRVFVWGSFRDSHGTMGLLTKENERFPVEITAKNKFIKIASGADHLVLLDNLKHVYTCGCGEQGQLGRLSERRTDRHSRQGIPQLLTPALVHFKINKHIEAEDIWAGTYTTFVKTFPQKNSEFGDLYVFGLNNYSQIGLTGVDKQFHPKISKAFSEKNWIHISSGQHHTIALDTNGGVFVLGRKEYGRLGLGTVEKDATELTPVPAFNDIKCIDVAAGSAQSFAVTESGKLYAWGMGTSGQLGTGEEEDADTPVLIESKQIKDIKVIRVAGGGQHTIILGHSVSKANETG